MGLSGPVVRRHLDRSGLAGEPMWEWAAQLGRALDDMEDDVGSLRAVLASREGLALAREFRLALVAAMKQSPGGAESGEWEQLMERIRGDGA